MTPSNCWVPISHRPYSPEPPHRALSRSSTRSQGYSAVQRQQQAPNRPEVEPGALGVRRGAADGPADENRNQADDQALLGTGAPPSCPPLSPGAPTGPAMGAPAS